MSKTENYKFFQNSKCEFFPCHEINKKENFNCLFCYCPLYMLRDKCDGQFSYNERGIKDCSKCNIPHDIGGYDHIMSKMGEVLNQAAIKE